MTGSTKPIRFLLDEHLSPVIAEQLCARSVDAVAVAVRPDLRTLPDDEIVAAAAAEGRIIVTRNIGDFIRLDAIWGSAGRRHHGILCVTTRAFPEDSVFIGALTKALADWAEAPCDIAGTHCFL